MISIVGGPTKINPGQIRLEKLISVERVLGSRGFRITAEGDSTATLLSNNSWKYEEAELMFTVFDDANSRADLLRWSSAAGYVPIDPNVSKLIGLQGIVKDRNRFSTTFEWYIGELLVRKFQAFSSSFGVTVADVVRNSDGGTSGDFDVLSVLGDLNLLYIECKSGACSRKSILNTIERSLSLHSIACLIFMNKGVDEKSLKQQLRGVAHPVYQGLTSLQKLSTKTVGDSEVYNWYDCFFVPGDQASAVEAKLRTVLRILSAERAASLGSMKPDAAEYNSRGYDCTPIAL